MFDGYSTEGHGAHGSFDPEQGQCHESNDGYDSRKTITAVYGLHHVLFLGLGAHRVSTGNGCEYAHRPDKEREHDSNVLEVRVAVERCQTQYHRAHHCDLV